MELGFDGENATDVIPLTGFFKEHWQQKLNYVHTAL